MYYSHLNAELFYIFNKKSAPRSTLLNIINNYDCGQALGAKVLSPASVVAQVHAPVVALDQVSTAALICDGAFWIAQAMNKLANGELSVHIGCSSILQIQSALGVPQC